MTPLKLRKSLLSLAVATALLSASAGNAMADDDKIAALEARIAELENLVQQLLQNQQQATATSSEAEEQAHEAVAAQAERAAEAKVATILAEYMEAEAEEEHRHSYQFGGYVKADLIFSDYDSDSYSGAGRDWFIAAVTPVGDGPGEMYTDFHVKESRINFRSTHNLDNGARLGTFLEMDFQLPSQGDERISNSYNPRLRHAFATYNNWLFGQTWMTFYNVGAIPENLDFVGPTESTIFGRQAQVRYTRGPWQFALENPETTITPYGGGGRIVADDNLAPDLVMRYDLKRDWGHFTATGMLRQLAYDNAAASIDDSTTSFGISLSGKFMLDSGDDFRWMASTGSGLGRYLGLNIANGAVLDENGRLHAIDSTGVYASYRHLWNNKWRSNLTYSWVNIDNDTSLTGMDVTKTANSYHLNLIYSPQPKLDFGAELLWADREVESGADGNLTRLQFSAKYAY
jgi:hypothetical protein